MSDVVAAGSIDRKGGPGHTVLLAMALAVPVVKVAYTVGGGSVLYQVLVALEPANWPDILIGMVLTDPPLGSVLAVVVSRLVFILFAARGAVPSGSGPAGRARRAALTLVNPLSFGVITACLYGPWWGLGTGLAAWALRQGVVVEYRTGRRGHGHGHSHGRRGGDGEGKGDGRAGHDSGYRPAPWLRRAAAAEQWVALGLTVAVLPALFLGSALNGRSWAPVLSCQVQNGTETSDERLIELARKGNGVVGWNLDTGEVSNGAGCTLVGTARVREAWWR
ncbi:hypothetical protein [Streptomyces sp. KLOTTS4A1]|uniref:hypothetical protein n=1 Tax=Streptomyces sp. KLOTTS4A1 TaxID=3390996 RepID=UPI0039F63ADD